MRSALTELDRTVSAQELYRALHDHGEAVGLATVYRALDELVSTGEAERIHRDGEDTYVLCPAGHHHHAICRDCGRSDVMEECALDGERLRSAGGFVIDGHQTIYFGRCPVCTGAERRG